LITSVQEFSLEKEITRFWICKSGVSFAILEFKKLKVKKGSAKKVEVQKFFSHRLEPVAKKLKRIFRQNLTTIHRQILA
jgi:hypothetical protein